MKRLTPALTSLVLMAVAGSSAPAVAQNRVAAPEITNPQFTVTRVIQSDASGFFLDITFPTLSTERDRAEVWCGRLTVHGALLEHTDVEIRQGTRGVIHFPRPGMQTGRSSVRVRFQGMQQPVTGEVMVGMATKDLVVDNGAGMCKAG